MMVITKLTFTIFVFVLLCSAADDFLFASGASGNGTDYQVIIMCKDNEREALLTLKQGLTTNPDPTGIPFRSTNLSSWGSKKGDKECCNWDGVMCNNMTGHVIDLALWALRGEISPALLELSHLNHMDLSSNDFGGNKIPEFIGSLDKLEYLHLSYSNFSGDVPYQLGNLTNLRELDLSGNNLTSKDLSWLSNLTLLSNLYMSLNQFYGPLSWLSNLTLLSFVDLSGNQFDGPLSWFSSLNPSLYYISLSDNQFEGQLPDLKGFSSLAELYLHANKLTGELPKSIGQLSNLVVLDVSYNSLEGTISDVHFTKLQYLQHLDLSFNSLALNLSSHWIPPFQLDIIKLAGCSMGPRFPSWLQTQTLFEFLDLSLAGISEEVPRWFWNHSASFSFLNLSHNNMSGLVPYTLTKLHQVIVTNIVIDISFNNFSGPLPPFHSNSDTLDFSHNMFSRTIQSICRTSYSRLNLLDLSYNQLSGELPNCFENMTTLLVLNLAENRFHGHLPPTLGSLLHLQTLILRNNNFTGELPPALSTCRDLQLIDCGGNALTGHLPTWMGSLANLVFIILSQNSFNGNIPPEICHLSHIQVLDLSRNNMSGRIPQCFQNFTSLVQTNGSTGVASVSLDFYAITGLAVYGENAIVRWKRQESEYKNILGLLKLIDFSSNNLVGNIPLEISRLAGLASLNLSQNHFTGNIFSEISQMKMLESLDLSRNNFLGEIPAGLAQLNFLSVLDLSSNNLSGKIPQGGQLHSFDASAYAGNKELCGQPLPNCPGDNPPPRPSSANRGNQGAIEDQKEGFNLIQSLIEEYFISAILGFIVGFWIIIGPLVVKRTWRNAYFGFWSMIGDWFYLMVTLSWRRLIRYMKSRK